MSPRGTSKRAACQRVAVALLVATGLAWAPPSAAESRADDDVAFYQGAFWGLQVHAGAIWRLESTSDAPGTVFGASIRLATLMSLIDVQLTFLAGGYDITGEDGRPIDVARYSVGGELHLHPFFIAHLENTNFDYWYAGIYAAIGADLDVVDVSTNEVDDATAAFGWHIGLGTDIPLGDVDDWGVWLGLSYRLKFLTADTPVPGLSDFDEHVFLITLAYRNNDIRFGRFPKPTELDDREPPPR